MRVRMRQRRRRRRSATRPSSRSAASPLADLIVDGETIEAEGQRRIPASLRQVAVTLDVDPESGAMFWFIDRETGKDVFYCRFCGIASSTIPLTERVQSILEVAPQGIRMPTKDELSGCPFNVTPSRTRAAFGSSGLKGFTSTDGDWSFFSHPHAGRVAPMAPRTSSRRGSATNYTFTAFGQLGVLGPRVQGANLSAKMRSSAGRISRLNSLRKFIPSRPSTPWPRLATSTWKLGSVKPSTDSWATRTM